jgi:hypothetical protein
MIYVGHLPMYRREGWIDLETQARHYLTNAADNQAVCEKTQAIVAAKHTYIRRVQELLDEVMQRG